MNVVKNGIEYTTIYVEIHELNPDPTPYKIYGARVGGGDGFKLLLAVDMNPADVEIHEDEEGADVIITPRGLVYLYNYLAFLANQAKRGQAAFDAHKLGYSTEE